MLPNVPPKLFSLSAVVVGYILIDDMTANEQNALGNWLMLVAQVLSTNAFYRQVMQERGLEPKGSTETGRNNTTFNNSSTSTSYYNNTYQNFNNNQNDTEQTINMLKKMIRAIQMEIDQIKKEL